LTQRQKIPVLVDKKAPVINVCWIQKPERNSRITKWDSGSRRKSEFIEGAKKGPGITDGYRGLSRSQSLQSLKASFRFSSSLLGSRSKLRSLVPVKRKCSASPCSRSSPSVHSFDLFPQKNSRNSSEWNSCHEQDTFKKKKVEVLDVWTSLGVE
jgi:hypothetical protein